MTRERVKELLPIITAFAEGKELQCYRNYGIWQTIFDPSFNEGNTYRISPEKCNRLMTREEMLIFITLNKVVVRRVGSRWIPSAYFSYAESVSEFEYAYVTEAGIGEPHRFEVEVEV